MEPKPGIVVPSAEEQARIQKERTLFEAKLLENGAEYEEGARGFRPELTDSQYRELHGSMERIFSDRERERLAKLREKIEAEFADIPIEEIIQTHPEIAQNVEAIRLEREGQEIALVRLKAVPEVAIPVWSKSKYKGGTLGKILLSVPESRLPAGRINIEFRAICACCPSEGYGVTSPFQAHHPKYPEGRFTHEGDSLFIEAARKWSESEEGQKDKEWKEQKKREFKEAVEKVCARRGIKYLAMRHYEEWDDHYGAIPGVKMLDITRPMGELRRRLGKHGGVPEDPDEDGSNLVLREEKGKLILQVGA
jgi:hypothetical protein